MPKQLTFIWLTSFLGNSGPLARLKMHEVLEFPQAYAFSTSNLRKYPW